MKKYSDEHQKKYKALDDEDKKEYHAKKKVRIFGNVSFIGQLIISKLLVT
jgi:hypothetical protein